MVLDPLERTFGHGCILRQNRRVLLAWNEFWGTQALVLVGILPACFIAPC
jgi:hypothetical protein